MKKTPPPAVDRVATVLAALLAIGAAAAEFCCRRIAGKSPAIQEDPLSETATFQKDGRFFSWGGNALSPLRYGHRLFRLSAAAFAAVMHLTLNHLLKRRKKP